MFRTLAEFKAHNAAQGMHFFDKKTLGFFGSKIHGGLRKGVYFITSEKNGFSSSERAYSIREAKPSGSVNTAGAGFLGYKTLDDAKQALKNLPYGR